MDRSSKPTKLSFQHQVSSSRNFLWILFSSSSLDIHERNREWKYLVTSMYTEETNVETYRDKQGETGRGKDRQGQTGADMDRQGHTGTDRDRQGQTGTDRDRQGRTGTDKDKQGQAGTSRDKQGQARTERECPCLSLLVPFLSLLVPPCPCPVPSIDWHNW